MTTSKWPGPQVNGQDHESSCGWHYADPRLRWAIGISEMRLDKLPHSLDKRTREFTWILRPFSIIMWSHDSFLQPVNILEKRGRSVPKNWQFTQKNQIISFRLKSLFEWAPLLENLFFFLLPSRVLWGWLALLPKTVTSYTRIMNQTKQSDVPQQQM